MRKRYARRLRSAWRLYVALFSSPGRAFAYTAALVAGVALVAYFVFALREPSGCSLNGNWPPKCGR